MNTRDIKTDTVQALINSYGLKLDLKTVTPELLDVLYSLADTIHQLSNIGAALSSERNHPKLLEMILEEARSIANADGGTLYLMNDDEKSLRFEIVQNDSLNVRMGGTSGNPINWYPVKLYLADGKPNNAMVSAYVGLTGETINIEDAYNVEGFDFSGTRAFDKKTGYRSKSFLVVPMRNHEDEIIGVLQLINALNPETGEIIPFSLYHQELIVSLASQAAVAITNNQLINDLRNLFESFIQVIASAIDEKSPYTGGHIERVAQLTMMIANYINSDNTGTFREVAFSEDELNELRIAAWLHDIGKITTPEYVVDKATKLETIYDRINTVRGRFEIARKELEVDYYKRLLEIRTGECMEDENTLKEWYESEIRSLTDDFKFVEESNTGGEFMAEEKKARIRRIAERKIHIDGKEQNLLTENEVYNLCIARGTLTEEEREIINRHVSLTIEMLSKLPFPKKLRHVPEYAGAHHEKLDGTGYPNGLTEEHLPLQARILALADVFEALTARDRPYKKGKTLSEAMKIMGFMGKDRHIDPDLLDMFTRSNLYLKYARENLDERQIDIQNSANKKKE